MRLLLLLDFLEFVFVFMVEKVWVDLWVLGKFEIIYLVGLKRNYFILVFKIILIFFIYVFLEF